MENFFGLLSKIPKYEEFDGQVFYDPKENRFLQLRGRKDDYLVFGQFTIYFTSAKTVLPIQQLSYEYAKKLKVINGVDETPGAFYNGIGWRVRKDKNYEFGGD